MEYVFEWHSWGKFWPFWGMDLEMSSDHTCKWQIGDYTMKHWAPCSPCVSGYINDKVKALVWSSCLAHFAYLNDEGRVWVMSRLPWSSGLFGCQLGALRPQGRTLGEWCCHHACTPWGCLVGFSGTTSLGLIIIIKDLIIRQSCSKHLPSCGQLLIPRTN